MTKVAEQTLEESLGELEVVETEIENKDEPSKGQVDEDDGIPEHLKTRLKGKTRAEIAQIVADQEKIMSRQGQEVGEVRRLADELIKSQISRKQEVEKQDEVDIFENPKEALRQAVDNNPRVIAAEKYALQAQQEMAKQNLAQRHPDFPQLLQESDFTEFTNSSSIRQELFKRAHAYDVDAADELFSTYKQLKAAKKQQLSQAEIDLEKKARDKSLQSASIETSGTGESSKKILRRTALMELQIRNPLKYEAMLPEIERAYAEGRVR